MAIKGNKINKVKHEKGENMKIKLYSSLILIMMFFMLSFSNAVLGYETSENSHWAKEVIDIFIENKYIEIDVNEFEADSTITTGEISSIINRFFSLGEYKTTDENLDAVHERGLLLRHGENDTVPREEIAILICKLLDFNIEEDNTNTNFIDDADISIWSKNYINLLQKKKIVIGYPDLSFRPTQDITKAEFITMISRCRDYYGQEVLPIDDKDVSNLEIGIFEYEDGKVIISTIGDELEVESGDIVELAISLPEEAADDDIVCEIENTDIVEFDDEMYTITALKAGTTNIKFFLSDKKFEVTFDVIVK